MHEWESAERPAGAGVGRDGSEFGGERPEVLGSVHELEDDLAAARTSLRTIIRTENTPQHN